jgi:hypothetical protein
VFKNVGKCFPAKQKGSKSETDKAEQQGASRLELLPRYYWRVHIKEVEMGSACGTYDRMRNSGVET